MGILPVPETPGPFPRSEVPEQERPPKRLDAGVSLGTATTDVRWRTRGGRDRRAHRPLHGSAADRGLRARQRQSRTRSAPPRVPPRRPAEAHLRCAPDHDARRKQRRQGFVEPATFHEITKHLIPPLDDVARFDYLTGSRKSEVLTLAWSNVDRARGVITIAREHSKNAEPRIIALTAALAAIIERRWKARTISRPDGVVLADLVFHREGRPVGSFRKAWASACKAAGVPGLLFHDLRRSAVRNFERAGVSQAVAMKITGHKTASVYRRYRIVDERDVREALTKTEASIAAEQTATVVSLTSRARQAQG